MRVIINKLWNEPAVVIGLLVSIALLVTNLATDETDTVNWIEVLAPFAASLGIRPLVTPARAEPDTSTVHAGP